MSVGAVGANSVPQLQTSWTRAEAACAARQRGDKYYELTHPAQASDTSAAVASDAETPTLAPGFTLHL